MAADAQPSKAFGPVESADETRQAQHSVSNDAPTDVNCNAALARYQGAVMANAQAAFSGNSDRREKIADMLLHKLSG